MAIHPYIADITSEIRDIRHEIHANPELGFLEVRTAKWIADYLRGLEIEVREGVGRTGVVGTLRGRRGGEGPHIGFRADMDALPIHEETGAEHSSTKDGVMHACGHDGHSAMLLGAAKCLASDTDFAGTITFIFQPAEELLSGAKAMIDDGLFDDHHVDRVFSIHNDPKFPLGTMVIGDGAFMAGADHFDLFFQGLSGHAARPEECVDPIVLGGQLVTLAQSYVSRQTRPTDPAVLSFTRFKSGDSYNVIPERADLSGTFRTMNPVLSDRVECFLRDSSSALSRAAGGSATLDYRRVCPVLVNDPEATALAIQSFGDVIENHKIIRPENPIMGTEDFAYMASG